MFDQEIMPGWRRDHKWLVEDLLFEQGQLQDMTELRNQYTIQGLEDWDRYTEILKMIEAKIEKIKAQIVRHRRGL